MKGMIILTINIVNPKHKHADENHVSIDKTSWPSSGSVTNSVVSPVVTQTRHSIPTSYNYRLPGSFHKCNLPSLDAATTPFPMWNWSNNQFSYPSYYMSPPMSSCELHSPENHDTGMFKFCFKFGNVSVCNGCRNTYSETKL